MERLLSGEFPPLSEMSPLALAFLGDSVYGLMVREHLLHHGNCSAKLLHARSVEWVRCEAQAKALEELRPLLTEEEQAIAHRGRNAHTGHLPKNAAPEDYHNATALEALFGALYAKGDLERLRELFAKIVETR